MTQQSFEFEELERVKSKLGLSVIGYLQSVGVGSEFSTIELYDHCRAEHAYLAPGSSCRILRDLKKAGSVNYEVVNRGQSKYLLTELSQ